MKQLLFICLFVSTSFTAVANARLSGKDCRLALTAHSWFDTKFQPLRRLDGALDGAKDATLLVRLPKGATLGVPPGSSLETFPELRSERDGSNIEVLHGTSDELLAQRQTLREINPGASFQVIDKDVVAQVKPRLGQEILRRLPFLKTVAKPFVTLHNYLSQSNLYARPVAVLANVTAPIGRHVASATESIRARAAAKLHQWRDAQVPVNSWTEREVRAYVKPEQYGNQDEIALANFFKTFAPNAPLTNDGALYAATMEIANLIRPDKVDANLLEVGMTTAHWQPKNLERGDRVAQMKKSVAYLETLLAEDPAYTITSDVSAAKARLQHVIATRPRLAPKTFVVETQIANDALDELFATKFQVRRQVRPVNVVTHEDLAWIVVDDQLIRKEGAQTAFLAIEEALPGETTFSPAIFKAIENLDQAVSTPFTLAELRRSNTIQIFKEAAFDQRVLKVDNGFGGRSWVIPRQVKAEVILAEGVHVPKRGGNFELQGFLRRANDFADYSAIEEVYTAVWERDGFAPQFVKFTRDNRAGERTVLTVVSLTEASVEQAKAFVANVANGLGFEDYKIPSDDKIRLTVGARSVSTLTILKDAFARAYLRDATSPAQVVRYVREISGATAEPGTRVAKARVATKMVSIRYEGFRVSRIDDVVLETIRRKKPKAEISTVEEAPSQDAPAPESDSTTEPKAE